MAILQTFFLYNKIQIKINIKCNKLGDNKKMKTKNILEAIDHYDVYSKNQKKILKTLVAVSLDSIACISVNSISEATKIAPNSIYIALRKLENDGCIKREREKGKTTNVYKVSLDKIKEIKSIYERKKTGLSQLNK